MSIALVHVAAGTFHHHFCAGLDAGQAALIIVDAVDQAGR